MPPAQFGTSPLDMTKFAMVLPSGNYKLLLVPWMCISSTGAELAATYTTSKITVAGDSVKD